MRICANTGSKVEERSKNEKVRETKDRIRQEHSNADRAA